MLGFAHQGGFSFGNPRNSLAAFRHALSRGARAVETDVWLTPDGEPVLSHDRPEAWDGLPRLAELYELIGDSVDLSVDLKNWRSADSVLACAEEFHAAHRLWLCGGRPAIAELVAARSGIRTVLSGDRIAADDIRWAAAAGITAVNPPARTWRPALRAAARDAGVLALGWDCNVELTLWFARWLKLDGIYSDRLSLVRAAGK